MIGQQFFIINGRVRPIWRFFVSALMIFYAQLAVGIILGAAFAIFGRQPQHIIFWASVLIFLALLALSKILTLIFEEKPLGSIGLAFCGRWKTELGIGLCVGAAMILTVASLEWGLGLVRFSWNPISAEQVLAGGAYYGLLFAIAATNEEVTFRGYPFQRLVEAIGPVAAVVIFSVSFGLFHLQNPSHSWLSTINTILIGIPLAVAYLRTRALWLPIGIHFAWNLFLGFGLGLPVSGIVFSKTLLKADVHGLAAMTGGNYGPEGSWLATAVILVATLFILFSRSIYISDEMRILALGPPQSPFGTAARSAESSLASGDSVKISLPGVE